MTHRFQCKYGLNLLTGDNGLGKTLFLDIAWWVLTRTWAGQRVLGRQLPHGRSTIAYQVGDEKPGAEDFEPTGQAWFWERSPHSFFRPEGLVIYARVDSSFSVCDSTRNPNPNPRRGPHEWARSNVFHFTPASLWDGLPQQNGKVLCNGLIRDWVGWQFQQPETFGLLTEVLEGLSPEPGEQLRPGRPTRLYVDDARDFPTIELPYATIPVVHASAGMKRVLSLAYLLVWTWTEHVAARELRGQRPTDQLLLLFDEVEAHLHPRWQRVILPAILRLVEKLRPDLRIQVLASTHAPLVLASLEPVFDVDRDRIFNFELRGEQVTVSEVPWAKQGDAANWLVSEVFGLQQARSREAEVAIEAAEAFMRDDRQALPPGLQTRDEIHQELLRVLAGHDPFWVRWIVPRRDSA